MKQYALHLGCYVRGSQFDSLTKLDYIFDYYTNDAFLKESKGFQRILSECPEASLRAINQLVFEDEALVETVMQDEEKNRKAQLTKRTQGGT
jgi:hypothetical protein